MEIEIWLYITNLSLSTWFILAVCLLFGYWKLCSQSWKLPPGPPSIPVLGSLPFLPKDSNICGVYAKLAVRYGNIFTVYLGSQRTVVLTGYQTIKEALLDKAQAFAGRPQDHIFQDIRHGRGISLAEGPFWEEQRRYVIRVLKGFGFGKSSMEGLIMDEMDRLLDNLRKNVGVPYDPQGTLAKSASNVVSAISFAQSWEYDDDKFNRMLSIMQDGQDAIAPSSPLTIFPSLKYLPGNFFHHREFTKFGKILEDFFQELIADRKLQLNENDEPYDLVGMYLLEIQKQKNNPNINFSEDQLMLILSDLFAAGTETTSTTIAWCLLYCVNHPDIQEKIYEEIENMTDTKSMPSMSDYMKLPYTQAVLSETQRLADLTPFVLPHTTLEDVTLHGYDIPKGTTVIVNQHSVHFDPDLWPDPYKFDPQRFLNPDGSYRNREELIPFSLGKRMCPGKSLAKMEMFLMLTALVKNFKVSLPPGVERLSTKGMLGIVYHPKHYEIVFENRG